MLVDKQKSLGFAALSYLLSFKVCSPDVPFLELCLEIGNLLLENKCKGQRTSHLKGDANGIKLGNGVACNTDSTLGVTLDVIPAKVRGKHQAQQKKKMRNAACEQAATVNLTNFAPKRGV